MDKGTNDSPYHSYSCLLHEDKMEELCRIAGTEIHRAALEKAVEYFIKKGGK